MELRAREIQEPKELAEIFDFVEAMIAVVKAEGGTAGKLAAATAELPKLITAIDGYDKVKEEVKDDVVYEAAGAFAGRVVKALK